MKIARLLLLTCAVGCTSRKDAASPEATRLDTGTSADTTSAATPDAEAFVPIGSNDVVWHGDHGEKGTPTVVTWTTDGHLLLTGDRRGYVSTLRPYRNFILRLDYRWPNAADLPEADRPNANTGVLVFITGEHKVWPRCLEVQGKWSEMGHIKSNAKDVTVAVRDDQAAREKVRKPVGEWNSVEVVAKDGTLTSYVNGVKIAESDPTELREGPIGFQSERFDVEFRNVRVREE